MSDFLNAYQCKYADMASISEFAPEQCGCVGCAVLLRSAPRPTRPEDDAFWSQLRAWPGPMPAADRPDDEPIAPVPDTPDRMRYERDRHTLRRVAAFWFDAFQRTDGRWAWVIRFAMSKETDTTSFEGGPRWDGTHEHLLAILAAIPDLGDRAFMEEDTPGRTWWQRIRPEIVRIADEVRRQET